MKIEKEVVIKAPISKLWDAIVDYKKFGEWFRCKLDQPFEEGEMSTGMMTFPGAEHVKWVAKVIRIENEKCLEFSWPPYVQDESIDLANEPWLNCKFELEIVPEGTRLKITEAGFDRLSSTIRDDALSGNEYGWEIQAGHIVEYVTKN